MIEHLQVQSLLHSAQKQMRRDPLPHKELRVLEEAKLRMQPQKNNENTEIIQKK
jgi:hypothetical protein